MKIDIDETAAFFVLGINTLLFVVVPQANLELFLFLGLISTIVLRALVDSWASDPVLTAMEGIIGAYMLVFIALVVFQAFELVSA